MNILDRLNAVIDYVELHITEDLDLNYLAGLACCSTYNFQRMFAFITEISIVEYIRKRRLTLAALDLQQSDVKVIDLALKYGYDSPVSFARAFQAVHGVTPSEARKPNIPLKAFPRMTFQITIKGGGEVNYRIVRTEPFKVFGIENIVSTFTTGDGISLLGVGEAWNENFSNGKYDKLFLDAGEVKLPFYDTMFIRNDMCRIHGLLNYKQIDATTHGYMQCSFVTPESKTDGFAVVEIPASTCAVFSPDEDDDCGDPGKTWAELYRRFYREWLPTSEFEKANSLEFEMYGGTPPNIYFELWMPVVRKS